MATKIPSPPKPKLWQIFVMLLDWMVIFISLPVVFVYIIWVYGIATGRELMFLLGRNTNQIEQWCKQRKVKR